MSRYAPPVFSHNILDDQKFFSEAIFGPKSHKNLCFIIFIVFTRQDSDSYHINMGMGFKKLHGEDVHASNFTAGKLWSTISLGIADPLLAGTQKVKRVCLFWGEGEESAKLAVTRNHWLELPMLWPLSCDHWATNYWPSKSSPYTAQVIPNASLTQKVPSELCRGWPKNSLHQERTHAECFTYFQCSWTSCFSWKMKRGCSFWGEREVPSLVAVQW